MVTFTACDNKSEKETPNGCLLQENLNWLESCTKLIYEKNRQETFKSWIFTEEKKCSASNLAKAGFYFIGSQDEPDTVQCFLCKKTLDGWEEDDDPWSEHIKHAPYCTFAKLNKPEKSLSLYELFDCLAESVTKTLEDILREKESSLVDQQKAARKKLVDLRKFV